MTTPFEMLTRLGLPQPTGIIQVGASSGQEIGLFKAMGIEHAVLIEPLESPFQSLMRQISGMPGYIGVNALCSDGDDETIDFHVASNMGESSSILKPARHLDDYSYVKFNQTIRLASFTLDRIAAAVSVNNPETVARIDMLFMDVQGAELKVLKGAARMLRQASYIFTEVGLGGGYEEDVTLLELIHFLQFWGYHPYDIRIGIEGWGNALFVKRLPGRLGKT